MRISAAGVLPNDLTVSLVNPDGRLAFSTSGDATNSTQVITLSKSGNWADFYISGQSKSSSLGDAIIEVHKDLSSGPKLGQTGVTVYDYESSSLAVTAGDPYLYTDTYGTADYQAFPFEAVLFQYSSTIKPDGISLSAAQLSNIRIAMTQNVISSTMKMIYSNPTISWGILSTTGTTVTAPSQYFDTASITSQTQDSVAGYDPLYDGSASAVVVPQTGSGPSTGDTSDKPSLSIPDTYATTAWSGYIPVGTITYKASGASIINGFWDWLLTYDTSTKEIIPLKQNSWTQNDSSSATTSQTVVPGTQTDVFASPITGTPFANSTGLNWVASTSNTNFTK